MEALREQGVDARMLVAEKLTDSPYIELAASPIKIKWEFLLERLKIYFSNGFNRKTLFKIDTGEFGLPLWRHPLVKEADAILINWVNQGMLSLKGVGKILKLGKPVIWTMHDMWNMTGICHHAGNCMHYEKDCGNCHLLNSKASDKDLSFRVNRKKLHLYNQPSKITFVAVSRWLRNKGILSGLLKTQEVVVIPNAFKIKDNLKARENTSPNFNIVMGAARLDDPIKGLDTLRETCRILKEKYPEEAQNLGITLFGSIKNPENIENFDLPLKYKGVLLKEEEIEEAYLNSEILVSVSSYETLPGTLVEGQAFGCIPVSFDRGGQSDIITDGETGFLCHYEKDFHKRALNFADGIVKAYKIIANKEEYENFRERMKKSVEERFSYSSVAQKYINLIKEMKSRQNVTE